MLKTVILLCCFAAFAITNGLFIKKGDTKSDQPSDDWAIELIRNYGYPVEYYSVETSDGYILDLFRIPSGRREEDVHQYQQKRPSDFSSGQSFETDFQLDTRRQDSYSNTDDQHADFHGYTQSQRGSGQDNQKFNEWSRNRNDQDHDQLSSNRNDQNQDQWSSSKNDRNQWNSGRDNQNQWNPTMADDQNQSQWSSNRNDQDQMGSSKPAVLLVHGLLCSADSFIIGGPSQGLAFVFADNGYDVYLANTRGSKYGLRHTTLNHQSDAAFWRFSSDEIGLKDLPAIMDTVIRLSGQQKIYTVGHLQGNTPLYIMASELPQYNDKIRVLISLSPVAYMGHSMHPMLKYINEHSSSKGWVIRNVGLNSFHPSEEVLNNGGKAECQKTTSDKMLCDNLYFLLNGYKSTNFNKTLLEKAIEGHYGSTSSRQIMHFSQLVKSGSFVRYKPQEDVSQGFTNEREYDLQQISAPVYLLSTSQDYWSSPEDVEKLAKRLPNAKKIEIQNLDSGLDFLYANNRGKW